MRKIVCLLIVASFLLTPSRAGERKISLDDLLARHLESIGTPEARQAIHSLRIDGEGTIAMLLGGTGTLKGPAQFLTRGDAFRLTMQIGHLNYPEETIVFDGENGHYAYLVPGTRSQIGQFHYQYPQLLRSGLVGGVWSQGWPLANLKAKKARAQYKGIKEVDGKRLHEVSYTMYKAGGFSVQLYFDVETFRHVGTIARMKRAANFGPDPLESPRQQEIRYRYEEWFAAFQERAGMTIPAQWRFRLSIESQNGTMMTDWQFNASRVSFNLPTSAEDFRLQND